MFVRGLNTLTQATSSPAEDFDDPGGLFTHWLHFTRSGSGDLWGIVLGLPDARSIWRTCPLVLEKAQA